jgi:DNA transposition AAA+ family ATPase
MPNSPTAPTIERPAAPRVIIHDEADPAKANGLEAMHNLRYRLTGDAVNQATANLPDAHRSELRWLHAYASENNVSLDDLAAMLKKPNGDTYSRDSVYQALTGRRAEAGASLAPICDAIARVRKIMEERATIRRAPFIETSLTKRIFKYCNAALNFQKVAFIYGHSQIGKTTALEEYQRQNNHGQTIYVRMPTRGTMNEFVCWLAKTLRIRTGMKMWDMKERIISAFDDRMLLIVDQCHECFSAHYNSRAMASLVFAMEIHDRTKCGLVLAGTTDFERGMHDAAHRDVMVQLLKRAFPKPLRLPAKPTAKNLDEFAAHYGLEPAKGEALELQSETIRDLDLGVWLTYLQVASRISAKKGQALKWTHVLEARDSFNALGGDFK